VNAELRLSVQPGSAHGEQPEGSPATQSVLADATKFNARLSVQPMVTATHPVLNVADGL